MSEFLYFSFVLRGGYNDLLPISKADREKLWHWSKIDSDDFVEFRSGDWCYMLNPKHVIRCGLSERDALIHRSNQWETKYSALALLADWLEPTGSYCEWRPADEEGHGSNIDEVFHDLTDHYLASKQPGASLMGLPLLNSKISLHEGENEHFFRIDDLAMFASHRKLRAK